MIVILTLNVWVEGFDGQGHSGYESASSHRYHDSVNVLHLHYDEHNQLRKFESR